jgi:hypothetical protein
MGKKLFQRLHDHALTLERLLAEQEDLPLAEIKVRRDAGETLVDIARSMNVAHTTIARAVETQV